MNSLVKCLSTSKTVLDARNLEGLKANQFEVALKNNRPNLIVLHLKLAL